jgi:hypothetical protein
MMSSLTDPAENIEPIYRSGPLPVLLAFLARGSLYTGIGE